ncbi:hypothetical protein FACS189411_12120 [Bacteroidia bacterium]|nr:hypothetical protein FACS189411_12120 [Bacteroidia bacterium]
MEDKLKKFRDRLRITLILYTFSKPIQDDGNKDFARVFHTEIKIQALDFLLRYPDFLSCELMDLMANDNSIDKSQIQSIIKDIYTNEEPILRVEEMQKFFYGAYESIDGVILFLKSVGFVDFESKRRSDLQTYDKTYYITNRCIQQIENNLLNIPSVRWYYDRCELIKKYFDHFNGSDLKKRQYRYKEYANIPYTMLIQNLNEQVRTSYYEHFNEELP